MWFSKQIGVFLWLTGTKALLSIQLVVVILQQDPGLEWPGHVGWRWWGGAAKRGKQIIGPDNPTC